MLANKNKNKKLEGLFLLLFVLSSMQGGYLPQLGVAPLTIIGGLGVCILGVIYFFKSKSRVGLLLLSLPAFYICSFLTSLLVLNYYGDDINVKRLSGYIFVIAISFLGCFYIKGIDISFILKWFIVFHVCYFLLQFIAFYGFGFDFDLMGSITGVQQKGWGGSYSDERLGGHVRRLGGLFNEPGSYVTFLAPAIALFARYYNQSFLNRSVFYLGVASLILTFSAYGFIFSTLIVFTVMVKFSGREVYLLWIVYLLGAVLVSPYLYYRFFERQVQGLDTGLDFRYHFIEELYRFTFSGYIEFLFGSGLLEPELEGKVDLIASVSDSSLFLTLILTNGFIMTGIWTVLWFFNCMKSKKIFSLVCFVILFLSKISIFYVYFVIIFLFLLNEVKSTANENLVGK